jgi:hypothetical protein
MTLRKPHSLWCQSTLARAAKIAEVRAGLIPHPHPASGKSVMREMQRREQSRFVAGIQRRHEAVEYSERRLHRSLIGPGLSLVDGDARSPSDRIR